MCNKPIDDTNKSDEHIILNAIGGRLKSDQLLCITCNSSLGDKFDAELAEQLNLFANFLNIKRHRGKPQPVKAKLQTTGEEYYFETGGKPVLYKPKIHEERIGDEVTLNISAKNKSEMRKVLRGLNRKYPNINIEELISKAEDRIEYINEPFHFSLTFGGMGAFRSVCKSAINFYIYKGGNRDNIIHLIPFLKSEIDLNIVWTYYPEIRIIKDMNDDEVIHGIIIKGNNINKILYGYLVYFNSIKYLVKLNDNYNGSDIEFSYFFDVSLNQEVFKKFDIELSKNEIDHIINEKQPPYEQLKNEHEALLGIIQKVQKDDHFNEIFNKAWERSIVKYPEGTIMTEEMIKELVYRFLEEIIPLIARKHQ